MTSTKQPREIKTILVITFFLFISSLSHGNVFAQQIIKPGSGELSFFVGPLFGDTSREVGPADVGLEDNVTFGFRAAANFTPNLAFEGILEFSPADSVCSGACLRSRIDTTEFFLHVNLVWHLVEIGRLVPYLTGGIGFMNVSGDVPGGGQVRETDFAANFGGGIKYFFTDKVALRLEVRDINTQLEGASDRLNLIQATAGLSFLIF